MWRDDLHRERNLPFIGVLLLAMTLSLSWPSLAKAAIFWDDSFEAGSTGFNSVAGMDFVSSPVVSGSRALHEHFCGGPSGNNPDYQCGTYTGRSHPPSTHHWMRFYFRMHNFTVSSTQSKMIFVGPNGAYPSYWWAMQWGNPSLMVAAQGVALANGGTVNYYSNHTFQQDRWYCVETHIQNNTPGQPNGTIEAWVDGALVLQQTGLNLRAGTPLQVNGAYNLPTQQFTDMTFYVQYGLGDIYYDDHAIGDQRIGCSGSVPKGDTTPPASPTGLRVN